jgi:malonate transporter
MTPILAVTVPFFALVLCGYLAARRHVLPESAIPGLNAFVLYFALPCLLFRFGANTPIVELLNPVVLGVYLASAMLIVFFTIAVTLSKTVRLQNAAFRRPGGGLPQHRLHGRAAAGRPAGPIRRGPVICSMLADLFVTSSVCIAVAQAHSAVEHGARVAAVRALRSTVSNPLPWSIAGWAVFGGRAQAAGAGAVGRQHAGRCRHAGGAVHHRRRAVACRPAREPAHAGG